jgi:mRNA-degrading endonuclease RelE of RelBE toxin-antitoxin system
MNRLVIMPAAQKQLEAISKRDRETIMAKLAILERAPEALAQQIKPLKGQHPPLRRLRVGDYRVLLRDTESETLVVLVAHRREVYR